MDFGGVKNRGLFKLTRNGCSRGEMRRGLTAKLVGVRHHSVEGAPGATSIGRYTRMPQLVSGSVVDHRRSEKLAKPAACEVDQQSEFSDTNTLKGEPKHEVSGVTCESSQRS